MMRPRVQQRLRHVAVVPTFGQPFLEDAGWQFGQPVARIVILKVQASGDGVEVEDLFELVLGPQVEVREVHVQRLRTVAGTPVALLPQKFQELPQEVASNAQVFHVVLPSGVASPKHDEVVTQVLRLPR